MKAASAAVALMDEVRYASAALDDFAAVTSLLERCGLPTDDLTSGHLAHFVVCRHGDELIGAGGVEPLGDDLGLLRSLAVVPPFRGRGMAMEIWTRSRARAIERGIGRIYLLTTTAELLFSRWGFQRVDRQEVPAALRGSAQYGSLCPTTAIVMTVDVAATRGD